MQRRLIALLSVFILMLLLNNVVLADVSDNLDYYNDRLNEINQKMENVKESKELIQLNKDRNKYAALKKAYETLLDINVNDNYLLFSDYSESNSKVDDLFNVADKYVNNSKYVFGGGRNQTQIDNGIFDCSSFVHWAYDQIGIKLGDRTSVTTDTLKNMGKTVTIENIKKGDLVFFDTYKKDGHVGIYAGNGKFLGAQVSTGVGYADMESPYWKKLFNGRIKRVF